MRDSGDEFSRGRILGSASWATMQQIVTLGGTAVSGVILARTLTVEQFGVFSYGTTLAGIGMTIMTAGLSGLAIKHLVESPNVQRSTMTALIVIREVCAAFAYVVLLLVSLSSGSEETVAVTAIALVVLFARAFDASEYWYQSRMESNKTAPIRIGVVLAFLAVRLLLAVNGANLTVFVVLYLLESVLVSAGLLLRYTLDKSSQGFGRLDSGIVSDLFSKSWILLLAGVAAQINTRSDIVILQALLGSESVGMYAAAARLSELFYFLPVVFMTATFPALLSTRRRFGERSAEYRAALQRSYDLACWAGVGIASVVLLLGPFALTVLYGEKYAAAGEILQIHVLVLPLVFMAAVFSKWIVAENLLVASLVRHALGGVLNVGLNFWLIPQIGLIGAAYATVISYAVASYVSCFIGSRTRVAGVQMSIALAAPVRFAAKILKERGNRR
ncbi:flippase [Cryobacterium sp. 1639]|uniref:flippase n=1 Tax=Cryobacterium inferilacus TaxID=2866629 RepID=UPI001C729E75|nr:flippase [Cryobacterium sp. 1639]MBX0301729.1 flippase [Cryobacterium sp. 1639]